MPGLPLQAGVAPGPPHTLTWCSSLPFTSSFSFICRLRRELESEQKRGRELVAEFQRLLDAKEAAIARSL